MHKAVNQISVKILTAIKKPA